MNDSDRTKDWFFKIEEVPVYATITRKDKRENVVVPKKKALVARDTGEIVGVVGSGYRMITNKMAVDLCRRFCREAFPDTSAKEWTFGAGHGPRTRSWAAIDLFHKTHAMNLNGGLSETYTPFARITNSFNGSRALRIDIGFLRNHCTNGMICEQEVAILKAPHTRDGLESLDALRPFEGMESLRRKFSETIGEVRAVRLSMGEARELVKRVIGWPELPADPKPRMRDDQRKLDARLEGLLRSYFEELGDNAYAAFSVMTAIAFHPPKSPRIRRDRTTLERRAGEWLRKFHSAATGPDFSVAGYLEKLAEGKRKDRRRGGFR